MYDVEGGCCWGRLYPLVDVEGYAGEIPGLFVRGADVRLVCVWRVAVGKIR
jgi:hypothetical protein